MDDKGKASGGPRDVVRDVLREAPWEVGSPVLTRRGGDADVLSAMVDAVGRHFRRGWRDLKAGIAVFMSPRAAHELTADEVRELGCSRSAWR